MFGTGVASFGHVNGVHIQNVDTWEAYVEKLQKGELPFGRVPFHDNRTRPAYPQKSCCSSKPATSTCRTSATSTVSIIRVEFRDAFAKLTEEKAG